MQAIVLGNLKQNQSPELEKMASKINWGPIYAQMTQIWIPRIFL